MIRSLFDVEDTLCATLKPHGITFWILTAYDQDAMLIRLYHKVTNKVQIIKINSDVLEQQDLTPIINMVMDSELFIFIT